MGPSCTPTIIITITIIPGANPNEIMSANESNCFPRRPLLLSFLAKKPSRKSNPIAANKNNGEMSILPAKHAKMEAIPQSKFIPVSRFGIVNI